MYFVFKWGVGMCVWESGDESRYADEFLMRLPIFKYCIIENSLEDMNIKEIYIYRKRREFAMFEK